MVQTSIKPRVIELADGTLRKLYPAEALFAFGAGYRLIIACPMLLNRPDGILLHGVPCGWLPSGLEGRGWPAALHWK